MFKKLTQTFNNPIRQLMTIRTCHHLSNRELLITQLYRELGEHHLRDDITVHSNILKKIRDLELANKKEVKKKTDLDLQLEVFVNNK